MGVRRHSELRREKPERLAARQLSIVVWAHHAYNEKMEKKIMQIPDTSLFLLI